jgi:hypothetical protein
MFTVFKDPFKISPGSVLTVPERYMKDLDGERQKKNKAFKKQRRETPVRFSKLWPKP